MIPRRIYQIWLSDKPIPEKDQYYIDNIKNYCINNSYEYILIDSNSTIFKECLSQSKFCQYFYNQKQLFFPRFNVQIADYIRCYILDRFGGIYLDTDITIDSDNKGFNSLLSNNYFIGYEVSQHPKIYHRRFDCGTLASKSNNVLFQTFMHILDNYPQMYNSGPVQTTLIEILKQEYEVSDSYIWPSIPELLPFIIKEIMHKEIIEVSENRPLEILEDKFEVYAGNYFSRDGLYCNHHYLNRY